MNAIGHRASFLRSHMQFLTCRGLATTPIPNVFVSRHINSFSLWNAILAVFL